MRALTIDAHGGPEQLRLRDDIAVPSLANPDDVRVRLHAAALNHLDLWTLHGDTHFAITPPWILGSDGAGVIDDIGPAVSTVRPGDAVVINPGTSCGHCEYCLSGDEPLCLQFRILGEHRSGTLADFVVVPARNVRIIPADSSMDEAAAYTLTTLTAWRMCVSRARVTARDLVLIWGAGGGVALAALRICKNLGARVWMASRSAEKLARARALGCDESIHVTEGVDVAKEVRGRTGKRGADVVIDSVGAATWTQSLGALGRRGRLVTCGGTSGPMVETDVRRLFWNQWTIMGSTMGSEAEFDAVTAEFRTGRLRPVIDSVFTLENGGAAFERLLSGNQFGKIVVRIA